MKRTNSIRTMCLSAAIAAMTLAQSLPAAAAPSMEGQKERHKVQDIHELDENAPHDVGGKVQFIPTGRAAAHVKAQKHHALRVAKAEKRHPRRGGGSVQHRGHAVKHLARMKKPRHAGKKHLAHAHRHAHVAHKHHRRKGAKK